MGFIHKKAPLFFEDAFEYWDDVGKDDAILRQCMSRGDNDVAGRGTDCAIFVKNADLIYEKKPLFTAYCRIFYKFAKFVWRMARYFGDMHNNVA